MGEKTPKTERMTSSWRAADIFTLIRLHDRGSREDLTPHPVRFLLAV
jgi:hypothetical protein